MFSAGAVRFGRHGQYLIGSLNPERARTKLQSVRVSQLIHWLATAAAIAKGKEDDPGVNVRRLSAVVGRIGDLPASVKDVVGQLTRLNVRLHPAEPE